jgi:hypothetical protein
MNWLTFGSIVEFCCDGYELSRNRISNWSVMEALYRASVVSMRTCSGGGLLRVYRTIEERLYQVLTVEERGIKPHRTGCWSTGEGDAQDL